MTAKRNTLLLVSASVALLTHPIAAQPAPFGGRIAIEIEAGPVWQTRNVAEIPRDGSATRISIADLAGAGPWMAGRVYVDWSLGGRHGMRLLVAPLTVNGAGTPSQALRFAGADYAAGIPVDAEYSFNSYRLSYRYRWRETARSSAWIGFTGKIRDAHIALEQGATASRKDDVGFVPLLNLGAVWRATPRWRIDGDFDGLAGGPGRAFDIAAKLGYDFSPRWTLHAGYRMVEGGADVPATYAFAWLHYAAVSVSWRAAK